MKLVFFKSNQTNHNILSSREIKRSLLLLFFFPLFIHAQKQVEIVHAGSLKFIKDSKNNAKRLIGDVQFKQDNTLMFCDSAYFYDDNSLDAFGHIHIQQDDSVHLYGDFLKYNGNTKKAVVTQNVSVNKNDMQLTTDILNYDVSTSVGYYTTGARIVNKNNILTSNQGYYFAQTNDFNFKKNVVLTNPEFVINSDTMRYNTYSKITYFLGPTTIKSDENLIYCEDGIYDTPKDQSRFSKNSYILTKDQKMIGDSLYYDRKKGIGRAVKNVKIIDTTQNLEISGNLAIHNEFEDLSIVTKNALLTQFFDDDTLYLHADTLKAIGENKRVREDNQVTSIKTKEAKQKNQDKNNKAQVSSTKSQEENKQQLTNNEQAITNNEQPKSNNKKLYAYHKVKIYKNDVQGKCDSMIYTTIDSTMKLINNPILWSAENQLTADTIKLFTGAKSLKSIELKGSAFIVSQEDSSYYNQIRGKFMKGYLKDNKLYMVYVEGNGQTIYFIKEKTEIQAVNRADCSNLRIFLKDNKIDRINFINKPNATLYPIEDVDKKELKLKDFSWRIKERPLTPKSIFTW